MTITAKYASICPVCRARITPGSKVEWSKGSQARHEVCPRDVKCPVEYAAYVAATEYAQTCHRTRRPAANAAARAAEVAYDAACAAYDVQRASIEAQS